MCTCPVTDKQSKRNALVTLTCDPLLLSQVEVEPVFTVRLVVPDSSRGDGVSEVWGPITPSPIEYVLLPRGANRYGLKYHLFGTVCRARKQFSLFR